MRKVLAILREEGALLWEEEDVGSFTIRLNVLYTLGCENITKQRGWGLCDDVLSLLLKFDDTDSFFYSNGYKGAGDL